MSQGLEREQWIARWIANGDWNQLSWMTRVGHDLEDPATQQRFAEDAWLAEIERREKYRQACDRMFRESVPKRAGDVAIAPEATPTIAKVEQWFQQTSDDGGILVLAGTTGTGKTVSAAYAGLLYARARGVAPVFIRAAQLAALSRYGDERDTYFDARFLIVDDIGAEYLDGKGSFAADFDELIDRFYAGRRRLVLTTNCDRKVFTERYGVRVMDRLAEAGTWIVVAGASRRKRP